MPAPLGDAIDVVEANNLLPPLDLPLPGHAA